MTETEKCWHYAIGSREVGPVSWDELRSLAQRGALVRQTLVWKTGMEHWVSAGRVQGLFQDVPQPVRPVGYAHRETLDEQVERRNRQAAMAMFVALIVELVAAGVMVFEKLAPARNVPWPLLTVGYLGVLAALPMGVFAAIFLPYRWKSLRQLGGNHRLLAYVGGFGDIVMLAGLAAVWILK